MAQSSMSTSLVELSNAAVSHLAREKKVVLERAEVMCHADLLTGVVRVQNIAYEKQIVVRYTFNNWETFADTKADWEESVWENNWPETDRFRFYIQLPAAGWSLRVRFAISYDVAGMNFWDNNAANDYELVAEKTWRQCVWSALRLVRNHVAPIYKKQSTK